MKCCSLYLWNRYISIISDWICFLTRDINWNFNLINNCQKFNDSWNRCHVSPAPSERIQGKPICLVRIRYQSIWKKSFAWKLNFFLLDNVNTRRFVLIFQKWNINIIGIQMGVCLFFQLLLQFEIPLSSSNRSIHLFGLSENGFKS